MAFEKAEASLIENATVRKYINSAGIFKAYFITPEEGYLIHDKEADITGEDGETEIVYASGTVTCGSNYDFDKNPREFYTVKKGAEENDT